MADDRHSWAPTWVACLGYFMVMLDVTIVSVATPDILRDLGGSLNETLWLFNAYLLTLSVLLVTGGRLGDLFGPRTMFLLGLSVFTLASLWCAAAPSPGQLIAARAVQGVGAALITPQTLALIARTVPPTGLGTAFGLYGSVAGAATIIGPGAGGLLTEALGWRSVFYINLPVGLGVLAFALVKLPRSPRTSGERLDLPGVLLVTAALVCLSFGLLEGERYAWGQVWSFVTIPAILGAGMVLLALFVISQRRPGAMIPAGLFRERTFLGMNLAGVTVAFGLLILYIPLTLHLQSVLDLGPAAAGLCVMTMSVTSMAMAAVVGRLSGRYGHRPVMVTGLVTFALSIVALALLAGARTSAWTLVPPLLTAGVGTGLIFAPMTALALGAVRPEMLGVASGVLNTSQRLGSLLAGSAIGVVLGGGATTLPDSVQAQAGNVPSPAAFADGVRGALLLGAAALLAGLACTALGRARPRPAAPPKEASGPTGLASRGDADLPGDER